MVADARIPVARFVDSAHAGQVAAFRAFDEGRARFAHLIWHRRGRKTTMAINLGIRECLRHANYTCRHILPTRTQAEEVVWNDPNMLFSYLPHESFHYWKPSVSNLTIRFSNGSRYVLDGADKLADARRGISGNLFILDEWAFHESPYVYDGLVRPILVEDKRKSCWFITTFNGINHAYEMWDKALADKSPDTYCHMMKASTSGVLSKVELDLARKEMPIPLFMQEFECEPMSATDMVLIQPHQIDRLKNINHGFTDVRRIISIDPAFEGDQCIIMANENTRVLEKQATHPDRTGEIVGAALAMGSRHQTQNYIVDEIGLGRGVSDGLREIDGMNVQAFNSAERAENSTPKMGNRRAEAWWHTMLQIVEGRCSYIEDPELRRQLCSVRYTVPSGRVLMELKSKVRGRLGRSPDDADAFVMALWGLQHVEPERQNGYRSETQRIFIPTGAGMGGMAG